jgi:hypothetical protein
MGIEGFSSGRIEGPGTESGMLLREFRLRVNLYVVHF